MYSFQQNNSLLELPLFFYAFSSGGTMSLKLPTFLHQQAEGPAKQLRIDGIVSVDAAPSGGTGATDDDGKLVVPYHPPVLHVVMEVSERTRRWADGTASRTWLCVIACTVVGVGDSSLSWR